jgi:hypothetical protein
MNTDMNTTGVCVGKRAFIFANYTEGRPETFTHYTVTIKSGDTDEQESFKTLEQAHAFAFEHSETVAHSSSVDDIMYDRSRLNEKQFDRLNAAAKAFAKANRFEIDNVEFSFALPHEVADLAYTHEHLRDIVNQLTRGSDIKIVKNQLSKLDLSVLVIAMEKMGSLVSMRIDLINKGGEAIFTVMHPPKAGEELFEPFISEYLSARSSQETADKIAA